MNVTFENTLESVTNVLKHAAKEKLLPEVVLSALEEMQRNPTLEPTDALTLALYNYDMLD